MHAAEDPTGFLAGHPSLRDRCERRLRAHAVLVDATELHEHVSRRVAAAIADEVNDAAEEAWIERCIDASIQTLMERDRDHERRGLPVDEHDSELLTFLSAAFGFDGGAARRAAIAFNSLPAVQRHSFLAVVVEKLSIDDCCRQGLGPRVRLMRNARAGLFAILSGRGPFATRAALAAPKSDAARADPKR